MLTELLKEHIKSQAKYVKVGYGQVEPNHLSAQRTGNIYAQLPADKAINVLEQGQFVKYDYAKGLVNFTGKGEWMLVFNEIKLYREAQIDCEFAMIKGNYAARVYSPLDPDTQKLYGPTRLLQGKREYWDEESQTFKPIEELKTRVDGKETTVAPYGVATDVHDYWEMSDINNPAIDDETRKRLFMKLRDYKAKMMPEGTSMVPRVFKTEVGDIYTTNTINEETLEVGDILTPQATDGILAKTGAEAADMQWEVVKLYTMPDMQPGVKLMRIK